MYLSSEGGAEEVTGSKHVLHIGSKRFLIDCGAFQGRRQESYEKNLALITSPESVDSLILTHAHFDHCGLIPLLVKRGFKGNIFSTSATRDLASVVLMDSANIQERDYDYLRKRALLQGLAFSYSPLYTESDVVKAISQCTTHSYNRPFYLAGDIQGTLYDAGHILGSAIAVLDIPVQGSKPISIAFTGDLGRKGKPIIRDPQSIPPVDYLILEATYGDRLHEPLTQAMDKLADIVNHTVKRGGKIIIPAFAIERTQELIFFLHLLCDKKSIPSVPIYIDSPMAVHATSIFRIHPECYDKETQDLFLQHHENPFGFNQLHLVSKVEDSKKLNTLKGPAIIISADGMCEAGRIQHHLMHNISDAANTILIVGYMAANTLGSKIARGDKEVKIHGQFYKVKASVQELHAFSAHADYQEAWEYLACQDLRRLKTVFLVHGESKGLLAMQKFLLDKGIQKVLIVKRGQGYELG